MSNVIDEAKNLITTAREQSEKKRAAAQREYSALLTRQDAGKKDDAARLIALAEELNIGLDTVAIHANAVAEVQKAHTTIVSEEEVERLHGEQVKAIAEHNKASSDWNLLDEELRVKMRATGHKRDLATRLNTMAREKIAQLKHDHPLAFGVDETPAKSATATPSPANQTTGELPLVKPAGLAPSTGPTERDMVTTGSIGVVP